MSKEKKKLVMVSSRIYQASLAICIFVIIVLSGSYYSSSQQTASMKGQVESLEADKSSLQYQVNNINESKKELLNLLANLDYTINNTLSRLNRLTYELSDLKNQFYSLQIKYIELDDIVNFRKSTILDRDKTSNMPGGGERTLSYSTLHSGYVRIEFTASGGVVLRLGSSFINNTYALYPISGVATEGNFTLPVFQGTTWLRIENPVLWIGATITVTITYIY